MLQSRAGTMGPIVVTVKDAADSPGEQETRLRHGWLYPVPDARRILVVRRRCHRSARAHPHVVESRTHIRLAYGFENNDTTH